MKRRICRILAWATAFVVVIALGVTSLGAAWLAGVKVPFATGATYLRVEKLPASSNAERAAGMPTAPVFVLLVGNDSRPGVGGARGDALHLVGINPVLHKGTIVDIPRDTCWQGDKINRANTQGGAEQARAVSDLTGVPVGYVVDVDFAGFQGLVDGVGGLTMNVPTAMHDTYSGAYFQPGVQHLSSTAALAFSRDRHDFPQSDIVRTNNQGLLILAAMSQLRRQARTAYGEFHLISLLYQHAQLSGLGIGDLFRLGRMMFDVPAAQIRNTNIPVGGGNCLPLDASAPGFFADFRDDAVLESH